MAATPLPLFTRTDTDGRASVSTSQDFNESRDGLRQPVQQLFNAKADGRSLLSKATVNCRAVAFQKGFQKSRRADNRCVIASRRREIPKIERDQVVLRRSQATAAAKTWRSFG